METLEELSKATFYKMENYSQLVIDYVQEVEDFISLESNENEVMAFIYEIDNILEVIDRSRTFDVEALELLLKTLRSQERLIEEKL
jgi:Asp-tRNA(Asn)/Glu-tRNA(Gln) amidotransferase C subunit